MTNVVTGCCDYNRVIGGGDYNEERGLIGWLAVVTNGVSTCGDKWGERL